MKNNLEIIKSEIENLININDLENAKLYLEKYGVLSNEDISYFSMKGIVAIRENNLSEAVDSFLKAFEIDNSNVDVLYNMGYLNVLLGNLQDALYFYDRCIALSDDNDLIQEVVSIKNDIENILNEKLYTFVMINIDKDDLIFEHVRNKNNVLIRIDKNDNLLKHDARSYKENNINVYEINSSEIMVIVEYILRNYSNVILVYSDLYILSSLIPFKDRSKIVYYSNVNYYTEHFLDRNINLFLEKECCLDSDFIVTNNIDVYNHKKIVENRKNIYLIDKCINETFTLDCILNSNINWDIKNYIDSLQNEYEKNNYLLGLYIRNDKQKFMIVKDLYEKYKNEELYNIYLSLLIKQKDYKNIKDVILNSIYCNDVFKAEVIYLYSIKEKDLLDFICNISIGNFSLADVSTNKDLDYRLGVLNFEACMYDSAYKEYLFILENNKKFRFKESPLVNRNISYLMYMNMDDNYNSYFRVYSNYIKNYL